MLILSSSLVAANVSAGEASRKPRLGGMEVFAAGQSIGWLLSFGSLGDRLISRTGYMFAVYRDSGLLAGETAYYSGTGCTGDVIYNADADISWIVAQGYVFRASGQAYYVPRGSAPADRTYASIYYSYRWGPGDGNCVPETGTVLNSVVALPNDPAVTGLPGTSLGTPIAFGVP